MRTATAREAAVREAEARAAAAAPPGAAAEEGGGSGGGGGSHASTMQARNNHGGTPSAVRCGIPPQLHAHLGRGA